MHAGHAALTIAFVVEYGMGPVVPGREYSVYTCIWIHSVRITYCFITFMVSSERDSKLSMPVRSSM